ncbi:DUF481 domain-containing protein [Leucothrix sargassi]|nr:DUF481 domain-containing protein [Leucothrix sargassi]
MTVNNKLALAVSSALLTLAGSAAAEVTLYDYTEATSAYEDAYLTGSFNANDGNGFDQASYAATVNADYERVFSSANRDVEVDAYAGGSVSRGSGEGVGSTSAYGAGIAGQVSNYFRPNSKAAFWFANASLEGLKGAEDLNSSVGAGIGYGRVINATPMAKTLRLVEALREAGELKATPSKAAHQQIANIINREDEYISKHGYANYEKYWFADIESALGQGTLGAGAVIEAYDVLTNEYISTRKIGWKVQAGVAVALSTFSGEDGGDPGLTFAGEYHKPLNTKTQFSNEATLLTTYGDDDTYAFANVMSLTYELSDKIDWENSWTLSHFDYGSSDATNNNITSAFQYELDNQLTAGVVLALDKVDGLDDVDASLSATVGYRLR